MENLYKNFEWLRERLEKGTSVIKIAQECGVNIKTIYKYIKKFQLINPSKRKKKVYQEKAWLEKMLKTHSVSEIAQICNVWPSTILSWIHRHQLPLSQPKQPLKIAISLEVREFIDGLMLAGAYFRGESRKSGFLQIRDESLTFLNWVRGRLEQGGISCRIERKTGYFVLRTKSITELWDICSRWKGRKLPPDFHFTPTIALVWFIHKGHNEQSSWRGKTRYSRALRFWVKRFSPKDQKRLLEELKKIGIKSPALYQTSKISMIRIAPSDTLSFLKYIRECPEELEEAFGQKWKIARGF